MLRSGEDIFLDDITVHDIEKTLQVPVNIIKSSGQDFLDGILQRKTENKKGRKGGTYEL